MHRRTLIIIAGVVLLGVAIVAIWMIITSLSRSSQTPTDNPNVVDKTQSKEVEVTIRDLSYSPATIKVKKGTKVTWVNQDNVGHNVVADDAPDTGGIPKAAPLFGRGQLTSVTFVRVGMFGYHCTPHAFMRGSVQVVD